MKKISLLLILFAIVAQSFQCDHDDLDPAPEPCNGASADTAGTNDNGRLYLPNAFTPNGDGKNDIIRPLTQNIASLNFIIYDQDNAVVFSTNQLNQGWSTTVGANTSNKFKYTVHATTNANHHIKICGDLYRLSCRPTGVNLYFEDQLTANGFTGPTSDILPTCP